MTLSDCQRTLLLSGLGLFLIVPLVTSASQYFIPKNTKTFAGEAVVPCRQNKGRLALFNKQTAIEAWKYLEHIISDSGSCHSFWVDILECDTARAKGLQNISSSGSDVNLEVDTSRTYCQGQDGVIPPSQADWDFKLCTSFKKAELRETSGNGENKCYYLSITRREADKSKSVKFHQSTMTCWSSKCSLCEKGDFDPCVSEQAITMAPINTAEPITVKPTTEPSTVKPTTQPPTLSPTTESSNAKPITEPAPSQPDTESPGVRSTTKPSTVPLITEQPTTVSLKMSLFSKVIDDSPVLRQVSHVSSPVQVRSLIQCAALCEMGVRCLGAAYTRDRECWLLSRVDNGYSVTLGGRDIWIKNSVSHMSPPD